MRYFLLLHLTLITAILAAQPYFSTAFSFSDEYGIIGTAVATDREETIFITTSFRCLRPGEEVESFPCVATMRINMAGQLMAVDTTEGYYSVGRSDSFFWRDSLLYSNAYVLDPLELDSQMLVRSMRADLTVVDHNNLDSGVPDEDINYFAPYDEGFVVISAKGYQTCDGCDTVRVIFLDRELQITREFSVHQEGPLPDMFGVHALVLPDGSLVGSNIGCSLAGLCGAVTRFDTTGQILWPNYFDNSADHSEFYVPKLANLPDGNFMVSWIDNHDPFPSSLGGVTTFLGMSPDGDTLWINQFADDDFQSVSVFDIKALANGDVLGIGKKTIIPSQHPPELAAFSNCGYICRVSPTGELLWERIICDDMDIHQSQSSIFYDFVEMPNGDFVLSGSTFLPEIADSTRVATGVWLVRTDSLGCVTPGCGEIDLLNSTYSAQALPEADLLDVWPNPASTQLQLSLTPTAQRGSYTWRLYDATGRLCYRTAVYRGERQSVDLAQWPPGLYSWQLVRDGLPVQTGRQLKL